MIKDINNILKHGVSRDVKVIDYRTKSRELKLLDVRRQDVLKSKEVDIQKLSSFIIRK